MTITSRRRWPTPRNAFPACPGDNRRPTNRYPPPPKPGGPDLLDLRERIDGIDRTIQNLIAERAQFAGQVGRAKGKLAAAVDYYRPEREAQVLRRVVEFGACTAAIEAALIARGVVLRPMAGYGLPDCLRITVGTCDENRRLLAMLDQVSGEVST